MCPTLEDDDVLAWALAVCKSAYGLGVLVIEACEEFVEVLGAEGFQEPFAAVLSAELRDAGERTCFDSRSSVWMSAAGKCGWENEVTDTYT